MFVIAGALGLLCAGNNPKEPVYQGKAVSDWLVDHFSRGHGPPYQSQGPDKAEEAMHQLGTNAIPALLRLLRAYDPPALVIKSLKLVSVQRWVRTGYRYRYTSWKHDAADFGFKILGTNAVSAVPELIEVCKDSRYPASQDYAAKALGYVGRSAQQAIPVLLRNFTHTNAEVRFDAVTAVHHIGGDPDVVVPAFRAALKDSMPEVRFNAVAALRDFSRRATSAIPDLLEALRDPAILQDKPLKNEIENILWNLVPETVAKPLVIEEPTPMVVGGVTTEALSQRAWGFGPDEKLFTLIPQGTRVRYCTYQAVGGNPLYLYRGLTLKGAKDHFLGHFEAVPLTPATNLNVEIVYIIDEHRILLCARDDNRGEFLELRRVETEIPK
jgi:hypothetical protein